VVRDVSLCSSSVGGSSDAPGRCCHRFGYLTRSGPLSECSLPDTVCAHAGGAVPAGRVPRVVKEGHAALFVLASSEALPGADPTQPSCFTKPGTRRRPSEVIAVEAGLDRGGGVSSCGDGRSISCCDPVAGSAAQRPMRLMLAVVGDVLAEEVLEGSRADVCGGVPSHRCPIVE
jgi:hypothetical protein